MFLFRTFFLTAVSTALCTAERVVADGVAVKAFTAYLSARFVATLRSLRTIVCLARLIADLIIGMNFLCLELLHQSRGDYSGK